MERRDLFKDEIERLGRALGKILAEFLNQKNKGKVAFGIEVTNQQLKTQLDFDINKLLLIEADELEPYLSEKKLSPEHIESLVDYIIEIADHTIDQNTHHAIVLYERALGMYAVATRFSKIYPFERILKEQHIKGKLKELYANQ